METLHDVALDVHRLYEQFDPYGFREFVEDGEDIETAIKRIAEENADFECLRVCLTDLEIMADNWEDKGHVKDLKDRFEEVVCDEPHKVNRYGLYDANLPYRIEFDGVSFRKITIFERPANDGCFGVYHTEVYAITEEGDDRNGKRENLLAWLRAIPSDRFEETLVKNGLEVHKYRPTFAETAGQKIFVSEEVQFMNDCIYITWKEYYDV